MDERRTTSVLFTSEFKRNLRRLAKRYRTIRSDLEPLIERLSAGDTPGDRVKGVGRVVVKVRLPNSDAGRGKSGGYRVVYYVRARDRVILITIYSKSDQGDVTTAQLRRIIEGDETA